MAKKTVSRGRAKTAKKASSKRKKTRRVAKSAMKAKPKARRAKAAKPATPKTLAARNPTQIKNEVREQFVVEQGNASFEEYFNSGSEHFGL